MGRTSWPCWPLPCWSVSACAYTGANAAAIALTADKPATKRVLRAAGLATPAWAQAPRWDGLADDVRYIVKSATADASIGLDDAVGGAGRDCRARPRRRLRRALRRPLVRGSAIVDGREFNVALLDEGEGPRVLPLAEMRFTDWDAARPKIVGYAAKWDDADAGGAKMVRSFDCAADEPALARALREMALASWDLFGLAGYARVDFRVDAAGVPTILEINPNPCLEPGAGFAAAAREAGLQLRRTDRPYRGWRPWLNSAPSCKAADEAAVERLVAAHRRLQRRGDRHRPRAWSRKRAPRRRAPIIAS